MMNKMTTFRVLIMMALILSALGCSNADLWDLANKSTDLDNCVLKAVSFRQGENAAYLQSSVSLTMNGNSAEAVIPAATDRSALSPYFDFDGDYISYEGQRLENGVTVLDFSTPLTVTVHARDGHTTSDYNLSLRPAMSDLVVAIRSLTSGDAEISLSWDEPAAYDNYSVAIYSVETGKLIAKLPRSATGTGSITIDSGYLSIVNGDYYTFAFRVVLDQSEGPDVTIGAVPDAAGISYKFIYNADELNDVRSAPADHYIVMKPIDLAAQGYVAWEPIPLFSGSFDGNGYTISNMHVSGAYSSAGLFGELNGAEVRSIILDKAKIENSVSDAKLGLLCAVTQKTGKGLIVGCSVQGEILSSKGAYIGAMTGVNNISFRIEKSHALLSVDNSSGVSTGCIGGFVGINWGLIDNSSARVSITSNAMAPLGGFVATNQTGGYISNSHVQSLHAAKPFISAPLSLNIGGFVGVGSSGGEIHSSWVDFASAIFSGGDSVGGFAGLNGGIIADNCSVKGKKLSATQFAGGFVAEMNSGSITDCSSACDVSVLREGSSETDLTLAAGGFASKIAGGDILDCSSSAKVSAKSVDGSVSNLYVTAGGFAGNISAGKVINSKAKATVRGEIENGTGTNDCVFAGGFAGNMNVAVSETAELTLCYANADVWGGIDTVSAGNVRALGGFTGSIAVEGSLTISRSAALGEVRGAGIVGGFIGNANPVGSIALSISDCHSLTDVVAQTAASAGGFFGKVNGSGSNSCDAERIYCAGLMSGSATSMHSFATYLLNCSMSDAYCRNQSFTDSMSHMGVTKYDFSQMTLPGLYSFDFSTPIWKTDGYIIGGLPYLVGLTYD